MTFCSFTALLEADLGASAGPSWWQTVGGLLAVFALLVLGLKLLGRLNRRGGRSAAQLLDVWHLGPRREIQVLRLDDEISFVYRHDNAMVLLKQQARADFEREQGAVAAPAAGASGHTWRERARHWLPSRAAATPAHHR